MCQNWPLPMKDQCRCSHKMREKMWIKKFSQQILLRFNATISRIEYFVFCSRLIRLIPTDQPNDHSVPDRPFRIQDRIPSRTNELILLSSLRWWYMYYDSMSICLYVMLCVMCVYHKSKMKSWPTYQSVMMLISNWGPVPWCSLELISMSSLRSGELISELMSFWHILDILDIYWIYWTYTGHILDRLL